MNKQSKRFYEIIDVIKDMIKDMIINVRCFMKLS